MALYAFKEYNYLPKKLVFRFLQIYCLAWFFETSCISHLENVGSLMLTYFIIQYKKNHILSHHQRSQKKKFFSFRCWTEIFQNFDLKVWILSLATNTVTAVFYKVTGTICSFLRKWLSSIRIWIVCLWIILSRKNAIPWKKMVRSACNSTAQRPFLELITVLWFSGESAYLWASYVMQSMTMKVLKGQHSAKLVIFTTYQDILQWN